MRNSSPQSTRRHFLGTSTLVASSALLAGSLPDAGLFAAAANSDSLKGRLFKTLKIGMVRVPAPLAEKFAVAKAAGFDGIELNAPLSNVDEARKASEQHDFPIDGTVCASHWKIRHTDPSEKTRGEALEILRNAIRQTHQIGGHTVLLVVGHGDDGSEAECWKRSIENIRQALPLAARLGIVIAIENVWNKFLYDHAGGPDQTVDKFVRYVDEFDSPWVGMQFDIGNHWKYGATGDWIRKLGKRIVKLDAKGFSRKQDGFRKIGEGDLDWADVRQALLEIGFLGWCAAEVLGGGPERLREVSANMDRVFGLTS